MPAPQLSDVQLAILRILWDRGEATAAEVHEALAKEHKALAPTTVATMLTRLERRGLVDHRSRGRQYVYRAEVSEQDVRRTMLGRITDFFFGGDTTALLSHLMGGSDIGPEELQRVKELIAAKERQDEEEPDDR